jgi:heme exporter protein B
MSGYAGDVAALVRKDLRLELRAREVVPAMAVFVVVTLVVFHFALPQGSGRDAAYGLLWVSLVFTALLGLGRAWVPEREGRTLDGLLLAPCDRSAIWVAKSLATLTFLVVTQLVALPAFSLFFAPLRAQAVAGVALADIGICTVGSLVSAMAAAGRARDLVLPLVFLPLSIPLIVGGIGSTIASDASSYLSFLVLYDVLFSILSWASFEYVVTE